MKNKRTQAPSTLRHEPYSFRLPKNSEQDPYFGGTRTFWNSKILGEHPEIKSVVVKQPGAKRGIRFILYASAKRWFEQSAKGQDQAA